jgi:hypothetical protein
LNCKWVFMQWQSYYSKTQHTKIHISHKITHSTQSYTNNKGYITHNEYNKVYLLASQFVPWANMPQCKCTWRINCYVVIGVGRYPLKWHFIFVSSVQHQEVKDEVALLSTVKYSKHLFLSRNQFSACMYYTCFVTTCFDYREPSPPVTVRFFCLLICPATFTVTFIYRCAKL